MTSRAVHSWRNLRDARNYGVLSGFAPRLAAIFMAGLLLLTPVYPQSIGALPVADQIGTDQARAQKSYADGLAKEKYGNWPAAFAAYSAALSYDPANRAYAQYREHARFQLVQGLAGDAEKRLIAGDDSGARAQLFLALQIDPTYSLARERLAQLADTAAAASAQAGQRIGGLPQLKHLTGTRDFDYRGSTRGAYAELAWQFGVKAIFDGDLQDRTLRFRGEKLDFDTALMILGIETHTFTRVMDSQAFFVAEDTTQKRKDFTPEVEKNLLLPASATTDDMNETLRMIREITGISRTQLDTSAHMITVRSTAENVAVAQALIQQLEKPRGELMLEIEILLVNRSDAKQMGVTPPTSAQAFTLTASQVNQLQQSPNSSTLQQVLQSIFGNTGTGTLGTMLPTLIAFGGGKSLFLASVPGASANLAQTLNSVRSAERVLLRAEDGKAATFFVGDRYPISMALLSGTGAPQNTIFTPGTISGLFPRADYTVGTGPKAVTVADLNNDAKPDIAVANADGSLSILLNNGSGAFPTVSSIPVGTSLSALATGVFNDMAGTTNLSIATTDATNNTVDILLGNGDGTFAAPVAYPTGKGPVAVIAEDVNGDGHLDLAVVNQTDGTVSILLGNGDGTFGAKTDYAVGISPTAITSGDFNADGHIDLAVTNFGSPTVAGSNSVSVLLGSSTTPGTFNAQVAYATGNGPAGIASSDFNRDGRPDLAVTNQTDGTVSVFPGNGDGTFQNPVTTTATGTPTGISTADFNGDQIPDIVVTAQTGEVATILLGKGDNTFQAPVSVPTGNGPVSVAAADVNGDALVDVITANNQSNSITVTLNSTLIQNAATSAGAAQTAYPSAEYVDLGLKVTATPHMQSNNDVTLQLAFENRSLAGAALDGIPVLNNTTIEHTVRLHENQTTVISGLLTSSTTRTTAGLPGMSNLPLIGYLTGEHTTNQADSELLIVVTPRIMRFPVHDAPTIYAGRGDAGSPGGPSTPPPPFIPTNTAPAGVPIAPGPGQPPGAQPPAGQAPAGQRPVGPPPTGPGQVPGENPGQAPPAFGIPIQQD